VRWEGIYREAYVEEENPARGFKMVYQPTKGIEPELSF
jgi:hypothetical protein